MRLRPHRRNLVVWSSHADRARRPGVLRSVRLTRARRIRRCIRTGALLTVIGLMPLARGVRARWRPLLAGGVLTVVGVVFRSGPGSVAMMPGMLCLIYALLLPASPEADRDSRSVLERELAAYSTLGQRRDLEATLDLYPDGVTSELRDILARQVVTTGNGRLPGASVTWHI